MQHMSSTAPYGPLRDAYLKRCPAPLLLLARFMLSCVLSCLVPTSSVLSCPVLSRPDLSLPSLVLSCGWIYRFLFYTAYL